MKLRAEYRVADQEDKGIQERRSFLLVNCVGYDEYDEPCEPCVRLKGRNDFYLAYAHKGTMFAQINGKDHLIDEGDLFIYKPHETQIYGQIEKQNYLSYWVHFTGYGAHELLVSTDLSEGFTYKVGTDSEIVDIFEKMIAEVAEKRIGFENTSSSLLMLLLSTISRKYQLVNDTSIRNENQKLTESVQYIHKSYEYKITVNDLANICHLSTNRYSILFKELTGVSPLNYVINFRLQKACEFMHHTNLNIRQISSLVGFDDPLYFCRIFKKYKKISPIAYKSKLKENG